ncbi:hypothetical protein NL676_035065 [Syzygium grande]|nr:hypothetical protein NL676_035065 [Syzygium grande]
MALDHEQGQWASGQDAWELSSAMAGRAVGPRVSGKESTGAQVAARARASMTADGGGGATRGARWWQAE